MNDNYYVSQHNKEKEFVVSSNPWMLCGTEVVKLEGFSGGYAMDGLDILKEDAE